MVRDVFDWLEGLLPSRAKKLKETAKEEGTTQEVEEGQGEADQTHDFNATADFERHPRRTKVFRSDLHQARLVIAASRGNESSLSNSRVVEKLVSVYSAVTNLMRSFLPDDVVPRRLAGILCIYI